MSDKKINVLMIGPARDVRGGITTVVNSYFDMGIEQRCNIRYIDTMKDGCNLKKFFVAIRAYIVFCLCVKKMDLVHVHMAAQMSYTRKKYFIKKAKKAGKKVIIHQHGGNFDHFYFNQSNDKRRNDIKEMFLLADKVIVLSEEWSDFFGKNICTPEKIIVLHNAVTVPAYEKTDYFDHNILFLGRLGKNKGAYDLLEVIPYLTEKYPDVRFYFGGDGDIKQCREIARQKNLQKYVRFLGWIRGAEKEELFKNCSIFVLPSYEEGMPMSVLEAMSYGLGVISTNVGGIPQLITNSINGLRFEAGDVQALVFCLDSLLSDCDKKKRLGKNARKTILNKFTSEKNIEEVMKIYSEIHYAGVLDIPYSRCQEVI
jgi:glycosyltransferase involved in cell wall biosynthesis